jgi:hypothetical protein
MGGMRQTQHPHASLLRQRAATLRELARTVEGARVMTLEGAAFEAAWVTPRARLCETMLEHNLLQLHRAAEDLREAALRLQARADDLDRVRA